MLPLLPTVALLATLKTPVAGARVEGERAAAALSSRPAPAAVTPRKGKRQGRQKKGRVPKFVGQVVAESALRRDALPRPSGDLYLYSPNWREEVKVNIYNFDGSFNQDSVAALSHLFRCKRTDTAKPIEPHLFEVLSMIQDHFGGRRLSVISGFRNQRKVTSFHFHGTAADIRIDGVSERALRDYVTTLDSGGMGIGIYPRANFVHVDIRPEPSYRWTDNSRSGDSRGDRLPPRGFKKKRSPTS